MACLLYILVICYIFTQDTAVCGGTQERFEILSVKEYTDLLYPKYMAKRKDAFYCDFNGGLCNFGVGHGRFHWSLIRGETPSGGTGPESDMSGKGSYTYIEASRPRRKGDKAFLVTPILPAMVYCLQFGFHAYGTQIGGLFINKKDFGNQGGLLLKIAKDYGKEWHYAIGTVVNNGSFQIEFEGVRGGGYRGDIAVDNIRIMKGKCPVVNKTSSCGIGYPGIVLGNINHLPPFLNWPWLVGLVSHGKTNVLCSAVYVNHNWLLTTGKCAEKFIGQQIATYTGNAGGESRLVVKTHNHSSDIVQTVLLELSNSSSEIEHDSVCLPPALPQLTRQNCYLLATSFSGQSNVFKETPVIIVQGCQPAGFNEEEEEKVLCVQVKNFGNQTQQLDGYVVCENKVMHRWILHAMGTFLYSNTIKPLMLTNTSAVVEWIDKNMNITDIPAPKGLAVPKAPEVLKGFQIFEQTKQKCLTYYPKTKTFIYDVCEVFKISQRFTMTSLRQIVSLATNQCLSTRNSGRPAFVIRLVRCQGDRRSQQWSCVGNMVYNDFYRTRFINHDIGGKARLSDNYEYKGNVFVHKTKDAICSVVKTVNDDLNCDDNNPDPMCGFTDEGYTRFEWVYEQPGTKDLVEVPLLQVSDRFFKVVWRGSDGYNTASAVLRSPLFNDQRCLYFQSYLYGPPRDQLIVYKQAEKGRQVLLQIFSGPSYFHQWRHHYVTVRPRPCEPYQIFIQAVIATGGRGKFALRDVHVFSGPCESQSTMDFMSSPPRPLNTSKLNKCLKGWRFLNGSCYYYYAFNATWDQASTLCQITGAELATDIAVAGTLPANTTTWFGVRSCLNGDLLSIKSLQYPHESFSSAKGECLYVETTASKQSMLKSTSCDTNLQFSCQKDPEKTKSGCGLRKMISNIDRQWPWHVVIVMFKRCQCAGTLVEPGYVVTSTLCAFNVDMSNLKIFIPSSRTIIHNITRIIQHPEPTKHDVAILIFNHSILSSPSIRFACVNKMTNIWRETKSSKNEILKGTSCYVLGWGTHKGGAATCGPRNYRIHDVEIVDKDVCGRYFGYKMLQEGFLCARPRTWGWSACLGDTGGPLICDIAGAWTLVGITKWGAGCADAREIGIYTDVASVVPWLESYATL